MRLTLSAFMGPLAAAACMYRDATTFGAAATRHISRKSQQKTQKKHVTKKSSNNHKHKFCKKMHTVFNQKTI